MSSNGSATGVADLTIAGDGLTIDARLTFQAVVDDLPIVMDAGVTIMGAEEKRVAVFEEEEGEGVELFFSVKIVEVVPPAEKLEECEVIRQALIKKLNLSSVQPPKAQTPVKQ